MKKLVLTTIVTVSLFAFGRNSNCQAQFNTQLNSPTYTTNYALTNAQKDALKFMYEEEKLARDVYITLGKKWGLRIFLNIQKAEQFHMNAVKRLVTKYNIPVNVSNTVGQFTIPALTNLYNQLITKGMKSAKDALGVGRLVELTDIKDLNERITTAKPDAKIVFNFLEKGSEHHLQAFNRWLSRY